MQESETGRYKLAKNQIKTNLFYLLLPKTPRPFF